MKEKILDKATEMFLTLGFKSVTMDDIAESLGISKKTIYQHFKTKTALVEASVFYLFDSICNGIDFICEASHNPIEELFHIKKFASEYLKDDKSSPQFQLKKYYPKIYERIIWKQFEVMYDSVKENIKKGVDTGIFRPEVDVDFTSRIYFSGMVSIKDTELFPSDIYKPSDIAEKFLEYHIRAIATEDGLKILNEFINENNN
ncbi:TetR/AcrR family transcriptional regulator [Galbibacter sp. BG1]|uniref:TetR/AcrR family transcriptional regulator n=1 Tax=Galbibacter sp. BG1 TaxID=1170699 RepID=UPI0015B8D6BC|nr:TetR/AcrR family transcriptional regulator [Galbibacter sp. BG1]QLE00912.1 TetR/AcrR family transcriptional regulator [Galbibacter sp. BG1]